MPGKVPPRTAKPSVRAVLAEADRLRQKAQMERALDPYAKPYEPSDHAARKLSQGIGPAAALDELRRRAADHQARYREDCERSERAEKRLARQHKVEDAKHRHRLSGLTLGQRLDAALGALATVSEVRASELDENPVSGSREVQPGDGIPRTGDAAGVWRERALVLVARVEDEVPRSTRRAA